MGEQRHGKQLDSRPKVERTYVPDEGALLAALRVVLGLPKQASFGQEA
jgi:hypothetical protein